MLQYVDPGLIIVNVINIFANLYNYATVYDSYKHHSKYPFDYYQINALQLGVTFICYSILTRSMLYIIEHCKALSVTIQIGKVTVFNVQRIASELRVYKLYHPYNHQKQNVWQNILQFSMYNKPRVNIKKTQKYDPHLYSHPKQNLYYYQVDISL